MKQKTLLFSWLLAMLFCIMGASNAWGDEITIDVNPSGSSSTKYLTSEQEFTIGGVTFKMNNYNPSNGQIRGNQSTVSSNFYLYNTTPLPGELQSVQIKSATLTNANTLINTGSSAITTPSSTGTAASSSKWTGLSGTYFCISLTKGATSGSVSMSGITITYEAAATACATPTFSPAAGAVVSGTEITISCATDGATIYYTRDGSMPSTSSDVYNPASKPTVTLSTTFKAYAVKDGNTDSEVATAAYTIASPCATPTFSVAAGTYTSNQSVELSTATEGATIYYTTDGTDPTTSSTEYTTAITIDASCTLKAIAVADGYAPSAIASATYTMQIPAINASDVNIEYNATSGSIAFTIDNVPEPAGTLTAAITGGNEGTWLSLGAVTTSVALTCSANDGITDRTATVTLTYTYDTDKTVTKEVTITQKHLVIDYAELPFAFDSGKSAIESKTGLTQNGLGSDYSSKPYLKFDGTGDYVILKIAEAPGQLTFDIKGNSFSGGTFKVQTSADGETYDDLKSYTDLADTQSETFKNLASTVRYIKWIYTTKSSGNVALGNIALQKAPPATPTFSVEAGEYSEAKSVEISCATDGATIYYTTDGTTPTSSSTEYTGDIDITTTTTLKAIAIKSGVESEVASATYTMNRPTAPTFDVAEGVFDAAFDLHLSAADGTTIYYTTDGSTPTSSSSAYSTKVSISAATTTVKAIAVKDGLTSDVSSATYTYDSRTTPTFTLSLTEIELQVNETSSAITLTTSSDATPSFSCEDAHVTLTGTGNSRTISANAAGVYTVNVSVTGSATYKDAAGTITVTVTKKATTMVLTPSFTSKDLYVTTSGSLTGAPQYNSSNIVGAEVTYSSSDETVATIAANGTVTFRKAGSTTITASYAGNDEYESCQATYVLDLTDSTPQETEVDITFGNALYGTSYTGANAAYTGPLRGTVNNIDIVVTQGSGANLYVTNSETRIYGGATKGTITISAPTGYVITKIVFNGGNKPSKWDLAASPGTLSSVTWTGSASTVVFSASGRSDLTTATVTLGSVVTLSSACFGGVNYYGTYSNSNAFVVPEGLRVSAITYNTTTKKIELDNYSTGDIVAAGEGVLVSSKTYGDYTVELTNETGTSKSGNLLVGTGDSGATASDMSDTNYYYYRLTMKDDKPGFWWKTAEGAGFALAANRAYLKVSKETAASARGFNLFNDEDETTGIHSIENGKLTMENGAWYTLGGQKMNGKPATKGIYIINGKKVVVK